MDGVEIRLLTVELVVHLVALELVLLLPPPRPPHLLQLPQEPMVVAEQSSLVQLARDLLLGHAVVNTGMFASKLHYNHEH
jgi:hypothetical protein